MGSYRLNSAAAADLDRMLDYGLDHQGFDKAVVYYDALQQRLDALADAPLLSPAVDHIRKGYRRSVCGAHSIYYRIDSDTVEIMRILNRENPLTALCDD